MILIVLHTTSFYRKFANNLKKNAQDIDVIKKEADNYIKSWLESNINNFLLDTNYVEREEKLIIKNTTVLTSASCLHTYKNDTMIIGKDK